MALKVGDKCPAVTGLNYVKGEAPEHLPVVGQCTVLEFWATWCPPCRDSIPHLTKLAHQYSNALFVGITNEDEAKVSRFVSSMGDKMDYVVACDEEESAQDVMGNLGARGIPFAVVVDPSGKIQYAGHPMEPKFEEVLAKFSTSAPAPKKEMQALPLITSSREELLAMKAGELKKILQDRKIDFRGCTEKGDFVDLIQERCANTVYYTNES